jgi:hypothetical protein
MAAAFSTSLERLNPKEHSFVASTIKHFKLSSWMNQLISSIVNVFLKVLMEECLEVKNEITC